MPEGEVSLQEPPDLPEQQRNILRAVMTILPMALLSGATTLLFVGMARGPATYLIMVLIAVSMAGMVFGQVILGGGERKRRIGGDRRDYLRYLAQNRRKVRHAVQQQRAANAWRHPDPDSLIAVASSDRRWERRPTHPDFMELRVGTGAQRLAMRLAPIQTRPIEDLEPLSAKSLRRFTRAYSTVADQPVAVFLPGFAQLRIGGPADGRDPESIRAFVRAVLGAAVAMHAPEELRVALCLDPERHTAWDWAKWLPHLQATHEQDAAGPVRLVADSMEGIEELLGEAFTSRPRYESGASASADEPYVVVVRDGGRMSANAQFVAGGYRNAILLDLDETNMMPARTVLCLEVTASDVAMVRLDRVGQQTRAPLATTDRLSVAKARTLATTLAPYRLGVAAIASADPLKSDFDLGSLLGIEDLAGLEVARLQNSRTGSLRLRVPIGVDVDGMPIDLDLKESALGGMGPHGMLIGATGSGKSELLRTLVLALVMTHSSETLNLILVDFKGGATFLGLDQLPHTSALITNLADEAALVGRMRDALHGELVRRQELLRQAGGFASVLEYERARAGGAALDPLPTLFVVVDEFSELLAAHRDFIELFVMIGRLGRSLGVHLLLASQRVDDGRIGQLESHLSYRIGLRTFSAMESRSVIGVPDAYELPSLPGNGYIRMDVSTLVRFKAAYVSGSYRPKTAEVRREVVRRQVVDFGLDWIGVPVMPEQAEADRVEPDPDRPAVSVLSVVIGQLLDKGPPAHQVWLPPLDRSPTLDQLLPTLAPDPRRGMVAAGWPGTGNLVVPVGYIDKPFEQARDLMTVDLAGIGGHVGIAGGPQSGKSTLLRTLLCALALTHSPEEVQLYCLDFGGTLTAIAGLPHIGSVAGRLDTDKVSRIVAEIIALIADRERRFAAMGIDSMASYRRARAAGTVTDDPYGDVFLVVDGWFTMRQEFESVDASVRQIIARGLNFGVHLILTAARWSEVHHGMRDQIGTRLELRLGDTVDSAIDLRMAATVPQLPGRGLTMDKLHFLGGLPRIDGVSEATSVTAGAQALAAVVAEFWAGPRATAVRTLPAVLPAGTLPPAEGDLRIVLGLDEEHLRPVWHNFEEIPHLTIMGDLESGKTNLLRHVVRSIAARFSPAEARIMAVDYRRALFGAVPEAYRLGYSVSADTTRAAVADAVAGLKPRMPGGDITPERLRRRDWWTGPRLFILVDDYEMLSGQDSPLLPLIPFLQQGTDIGFHLVLTRGTANVMRMSMDAMIRRLQETNSPDVVLSCPPNEGPLLGNTKARLLPPGRAQLCTRRGTRMIQTAWADPALDPVGAVSAAE